MIQKLFKHLCSGITLISSVLLLVADRSTWAADHDPALADRCRHLLETTVLDFYFPACVDQQFGGFLETLDADGHFAPGTEKFLTLQARQLWTASTMAEADLRPAQLLPIAQQGYAFIANHFRDPHRGGYFSKVSAAGEPVDRRKHLYLNAFALYALTAYYRASRDPQVLADARQLFHDIEQHAYDEQHGGYQEFFTDDWQLITDPQAAGYIGASGTKTYNTHLHMLEAYAALYRIWPNELLGKRLAELIQINTNTVRHPEARCNVDGWHPDWRMIETPQNLRASYGHDIECAWLVLDAADSLGWSPRLLRSWATDLVDRAVHDGYDQKHGGFFYSGPLSGPADDTRKEWWVQAEALPALLVVGQLTGDPRHRERFVQTLDFIERHQVADRGGWWATRAADGSAHRNQSRSSPWQGAYHSGRGLLIAYQRLK